MALTYNAGWDFSRIGSFVIEITTNEPVTFTTTISSGTYSHLDMQSILGSGNYDEFLNPLIAALNAAAAAATPTPSTRTFNDSSYANGVYSIVANTGTIVATANTNTVARRILGLSTIPTSAAISFASEVRPYYYLVPSVTARSNVTDDYEGGEIAWDGEADDGNSYGISRLTPPLYHDWVQAAEAKAACFKNSATSSVPWTYQHLFEHCRNIEPIYVQDSLGGSGTDDMIVKLRADSCKWKPRRVWADFDDRWDIPFNCRVLQSSAGVNRL